MTTREVSDLGEVQSLVDAYPFKPYRHYRVYSRKAQNAVMRQEIAETLDHPDGTVIAVDAGKEPSFAVVRRLDWDSIFFQVPMGRVEYILTSSRDSYQATLDAAVGALRARGVRHISIRADVADIESVAVLEANGFRLMDSLVTYTTRPRKEPPHDVREVGTIRPLRAEDGPALLEITADAYRGFRGRFHLDPHINVARSDAFYVEWARQSINGSMADMVLVAEGADGRVNGYLAFRKREPVSSIGGTDVYGGGLGACRADAPGGYAGLIRAGTIWAHERGAVAECQTQNYNFPTIRIYEAVGAHYVRADYTLHRWLD